MAVVVGRCVAGIGSDGVPVTSEDIVVIADVDDIVDSTRSDGEIVKEVVAAGVRSGGLDQRITWVNFSVTVGVEIEIDGDTRETGFVVVSVR